MSISVTLVGLNGVTRRIETTASAARDAGRTVVTVGSNLPYARNIETGIRRSKPWRRAGGAHMLERGFNEELPSISKDIGAALDEGRAIGPVLLEAGYRVQRRTQTYTPVKTGSLRRSFHTVRTG